MSGRYNGGKNANVKPCPFCNNHHHGELLLRNEVDRAQVVCGQCGACGPMVSSDPWLVPELDPKTGKSWRYGARLEAHKRALNVRACTAWDDRAALTAAMEGDS